PAHGRIREVVVYFLRLGLLGFGGPVALVGQMERELVAERKWLTNEQMREAIAICQSLPGPLAIQVGIYVSYLRTGFWGGMGRRLVFYLPIFRDRRGARRPLRLSRRSAAGKRRFLRGEPRRDRADPPFLLPAGETGVSALDLYGEGREVLRSAGRL